MLFAAPLSATAGVRVRLAGFPVHVVCADNSLLEDVAACFGGAVPETDAAAVLALQVVPHNAPCSPDRDRAGAGVTLHGEDEYEGAIDLNSGHGWVRLTGSFPRAALANALRQVAARLVRSRHGLVLHAAAVMTHGSAVLLAGCSGAGKSTVCGLCESGVVLSDDLVAVRQVEGQFVAWGLPTPTPAARALRDRADAAVSAAPSRADCRRRGWPITTIFFLHQALETHTEVVSGALVSARLLAFPRGTAKPRRAEQHLDLLAQLTTAAACFDLYFRADHSVWDCIEAVLCRTRTAHT